MKFKNIFSIFKEENDKLYKEKYLVGTIPEFEKYLIDILKEDKAGSINFGSPKGSGDICVYSSEGQYPHCHIRFSSKNEHDCCIMLEEPKYFLHGSKDNMLNSAQMKAFVTWCKDINGKYSTLTNQVTNYTAMKILWNKNNPNMPQTDVSKTEIPEYKSNMGKIL